MIDSILSLIFSITSNKGSYALLLGSGISRPAGIPTGWEITLDLIQKIALLLNENIESEPEKWYLNKFGKEPNYSDLLNSILKTPTERNSLLRSYFEPTAEEIEQGLKIPTIAHNSIAKLVKDGFIKVIVTTNFDRLLEIALEKENIIPNVISTPDSLKGAYPIIHSKCTVIKINGDYLDTRIRNTFQELEEYDAELDALLDRIFDEFGLIICGWSAEWDIALRNAIQRSKSRRFSTFWVIKDSVNQFAKDLINLRSAEVISNTTADKFFAELLEKSTSVNELEKTHPLSKKIAIATAKKYLAENKYQINLHDLIFTEVKRLNDETTIKKFPTQAQFSEDEMIRRIKLYESKTEILINLSIITCYWGNSTHLEFINKLIDAVANVSKFQSGSEAYIKLRKYPALLIMYSAGIASLAVDKYDFLKSILLNTNINDEYSEKPGIISLLPQNIINKELAGFILKDKRAFTPFNDYLFSVLQTYFQDIIINKNFFYLYDKFEYLIALIFADLKKDAKGPLWVPQGSYCWRNAINSPNNHITKTLEREINKMELNTHY